jgi:hypothetical protein
MNQNVVLNTQGYSAADAVASKKMQHMGETLGHSARNAHPWQHK